MKLKTKFAIALALAICTHPHESVKAQEVKDLVISSKEIQEQEKLFKTQLTMAVEYLLKNKNEISNHIDPKIFNVIAKRVGQGQFEKLEEFNKSRQVKLRNGAVTMLQGSLTNLTDLGTSLYEAQDERNIKSSFAEIYNVLSPKSRTLFKTPAEVSKMSKGEAQKELTRLYTLIPRLTFIVFKPTSPGWKWECDDEIGQQYVGFGDRADRCTESEFHADSLVNHASTTQFPLKYLHTCMKDQARRGTCVGFAISAAVESKLMLKEDKSYNLSEQFTYFYGEIYAGHGGRYEYGLNTGNTIGKLDSDNIKFQYESFWEYNPSTFIEERTGDIHPKSCNGYSGEKCTNFAFQANESVTGIWPFQTYRYTVPHRGTSKNIQITDRSGLWNPIFKDNALTAAIALLNAKIPLVISFNVKENFMNTGSDGYVYHRSGQENLGGHASVLLGFIKNADLPPGVTPATEKGFFIVKNSWGIGSGDCGYYYMDYKYAKDHISNMYTIKIN